MSPRARPVTPPDPIDAATEMEDLTARRLAGDGMAQEPSLRCRVCGIIRLLRSSHSPAEHSSISSPVRGNNGGVSLGQKNFTMFLRDASTFLSVLVLVFDCSINHISAASRPCHMGTFLQMHDDQRPCTRRRASKKNSCAQAVPSHSESDSINQGQRYCRSRKPRITS